MEKKDLITIGDGVANLRRVLCRLALLRSITLEDMEEKYIYAWRDMVELSLEYNIKEMNEILTDISEDYEDIKFKPVEYDA